MTSIGSEFAKWEKSNNFANKNIDSLPNDLSRSGSSKVRAEGVLVGSSMISERDVDSQNWRKRLSIQ